MQTGVLTSENLSTVLRDISQKRRQGVLEVTGNESKLLIHFIQGRVAEVEDAELAPQLELFAKFQKMGLVPADQEFSGEDYRALFDKVVSEMSVLDPVAFKAANRHRVLDHLYGLDVSSGAFYTFRIQMVEVERDFASSVSVGQLLLDLVALEGDAERFSSTFADDSVLVQDSIAELALSEDEQIAYDLIGEGISVADFKQQTLLSRYHIQECLLALKDQGAIGLSSSNGAVVAAESDDGPSLDQFMDSLDSSMDGMFEGMEEEEAAQEIEDTGEEPGHVEVPQSSDVDQEVELDEYEDDDLQLSFQMRMTLLNSRMLNANALPHIVIFLFVVIALCAPWLTWEAVIEGFAQF